MRRLMLLLFLLAAAVPATASAKLTVAISENNPVMFGDPNFTELGAKQTRLVVSWNAYSAAQNGDNEYTDRDVPYMKLAQEHGTEVMVAFEHSRGAPPDCRKSHKGQCRLPSVSEYKAEITKFLTAQPTVKYVTAWNEVNHPTQPTYTNPTRAGQYAKAAEQVCTKLGTCKVVALDILDAANNATLPTKKLNYSRTISYVKKLRKAYGKTPAICGIHNYADVNRFRTTGSRAIAKAVKCKSYWFTETGGFYNFASFWTKRTRKNAVGGKCTNATTCQQTAMKYLFNKSVKSIKRLKRVYVFAFYSGNAQFDAGIVKGDGTAPVSTKRPVFDIVKSHIG